MANQANWPGDFDALARQYWTGWNEMMRQAASAGGTSGFAQAPGFGATGFSMPGFGAPAFAAPGFGATQAMPGMGGWQDMLAQWSRMAMAMGAQQPRQPDLGSTLNDTLGRFQAQAGDWYGRMQQLAAQVAGQGMSAADIAGKWKELLEQNGEGAWLEMFRAMQSPQAHGFEQWYEAVQPMLAGWRTEAKSMLGLPTMGLAREHQERLQKLMQAQLDYQDSLSAHNAALAQNAQQAYKNFEAKLAEHELPGSEITSGRALFDLWIDAAEDAFSEMALSPDYREVYGAMINAQMRLRQDVQREIENASAMVGIPTRTEIEAAHRKIAELERIVRRMQRGEAAPTARADAPPRPVARPRSPAKKVAARKVAAKKTASKKAPAKKAVAKQAAVKKAAARKTAARKPSKKAVKRSR